MLETREELVEKGYNQDEGIDYEEIYAQVAGLEVIRVLLTFACIKGFKLYQMVKSAFLNGYIMEEVYVKQLSSFEDVSKPGHVFRLQLK